MPSYSLPSYNHACKTQTSMMVTYSNERGLMGKLSRTHIHFIYTLFSQQNTRSICSILRHTHNHSANNIFFIYFYFQRTRIKVNIEKSEYNMGSQKIIEWKSFRFFGECVNSVKITIADIFVLTFDILMNRNSFVKT